MSDSPAAGASGIRVADVIPRLQLRGAEVFAAHLAVALSDRYRSRLFTVSGSGTARPPRTTMLDVHQGPTSGSRAHLARALGHALAEDAPDLIVAHGGDPLRAVMRSHPRTPIVYLRIASVPPQFRRGIRGRSLRAAYAGVTEFVAVSRSLERELIDDFGIDPARVTMIPNGRPAPPPLSSERRAALRADLGADAGDLLVVWVGGLVPEKNPEAVPRIAEVVQRVIPNVRFAQIGSGPIAIASTSSVHVGPSRDDAPDVIAVADMLLSTSATEGLPGVIIEALLAGVPIVAPDVGGIGEIVTSDTGILGPPGDEHALAEGVIRLAGHPDALATMSTHARAQGRTFEIGAVADRFDEVYRRAILASHPKESDDES